LIATRIDEAQAQYRLLDTTRAYELEKLEEHAEVDVVFRRHAEYVAGYLVTPDLIRAKQMPEQTSAPARQAG